MLGRLIPTSFALLLLIGLAASGAGCTEKKKGWDSSQFAGVSRNVMLQKWQGTWVLPFRSSRPGEKAKSAIGTREIWTVKGGRVDRYDGVRTQERHLRIIAPCLADFRWAKRAKKNSPGTEGISYRAFYFNGETLHVGNVGGYTWKGTTFVCFSSGEPRVVTQRGSTCHLWEYPVVHQVRKMKRHKAKCSIVTEGDKRFFEIRSPKLYRGKERLLFSGDLLVDPRNPAQPARKYPSHQAAFKALTAKR
jgi:hypothetical protein